MGDDRSRRYEITDHFKHFHVSLYHRLDKENIIHSVITEYPQLFLTGVVPLNRIFGEQTT